MDIDSVGTDLSTQEVNSLRSILGHEDDNAEMRSFPEAISALQRNGHAVAPNHPVVYWRATASEILFRYNQGHYVRRS